MRLILLVFLFIPTTAFAELQECNGVWTNGDCPNGSKVQKSLAEKEFDREKYEQVLKSNARYRLERLIRDYNLSNQELQDAIRICSLAEASLDECSITTDAAIVKAGPDIERVESARASLQAQKNAASQQRAQLESIRRQQSDMSDTLRQIEWNQRNLIVPP